jgi:hypothetical protein
MNNNRSNIKNNIRSNTRGNRSSYKYENYFTNTGVMINRGDGTSYNIKPIKLDAVILNFLISNELLSLKQEQYFDSKLRRNVVFDRIKINNYPNLFVEYRDYQRDMRSVKIVEGEKTFTRKKGMMIEDVEIQNSKMKIPFMTENQRRKLYEYDFEYMEANQMILNAKESIEITDNGKRIKINIKNDYIQELIKNKIVNEIFDYRTPQYLKIGTILEEINVDGNKYLLLGYLDPFKMENYCVKYGEKYLFELPEFQEILEEQRNNKEFLIDFLNFFYYNRKDLNEEDLWKLSYFGVGLEKWNTSREIFFPNDFDQVSNILKENNNELFNIFKIFLNDKMKSSLNRLYLRLKYNFMIFRIIDNKIVKYINSFRDLKQEDTNILKAVLSKIQELIPKSIYFHNLKDNEQNYKNFISYIKTDEVFIIHVEYLNPYSSIKLKSFYYNKMILFEDLIDYSSITNKENMPLLTSFEGVKYYRETNIKEQNGGDIQELIKENEWSNSKKNEYIFDKDIRVLFSNTDDRQIVHNILYKVEDNKIEYYYMKIIPNLNYYYNKKNEKQSFDKFNRIIDSLTPENISCDFKNLKLYHYTEKDFYSHKIFVKKIDLNSRYFIIDEKGIMRNNDKIMESYLYYQFLVSAPMFYFLIDGNLYRRELRKPEIEIQGKNFKNYLYYYSYVMIKIFNKSMKFYNDIKKIEMKKNNAISEEENRIIKENITFEDDKYYFFVKRIYQDNNYKYVGFLIEKKLDRELNRNRNNHLIPKGEDCISNIIQANNEQIKIIKNFLDKTIQKLIDFGDGETKEDFFIYTNRKNPLEHYCIHFHIYLLKKKENIEKDIYPRSVQYDYMKNVNMNNNSLVYKSNDFNKKKNLFGYSDLSFPEIILYLLQNN